MKEFTVYMELSTMVSSRFSLATNAVIDGNSSPNGLGREFPS
jgi:hypothetical protein